MAATVLQPEGWAAPRGYANGVVTSGRLVFVAGQIGWNAQCQFEHRDLVGQTRQTLANIVAVLADAGTSLANVAKVNIFTTDFSLLPRMNSVYSQYFTHRPAKTTVEISRLDRGALIEIEVVAGV